MNNKVKKSATGTGEIATIALFMAGLLSFFAFSDWLATWNISPILRTFFFFLVLYVGAQLLATIIDFLQSRYRLTFKNFFILWSGYLFMTLVNLLLLILTIPALILQFIIGPVAFFVGFISLATLILYFVQHILGFDWVGHPPDTQAAKYALIGLGACLGLFGLVYYWVSRNIHPENLLIDFWIDHVVVPAEELHKKWMGYLDK
ncbi:MAG: hypothetical protein R3E32_07715 [Chitinophagales bacterium]